MDLDLTLTTLTDEELRTLIARAQEILDSRAEIVTIEVTHARKAYYPVSAAQYRYLESLGCEMRASKTATFKRLESRDASAAIDALKAGTRVVLV